MSEAVIADSFFTMKASFVLLICSFFLSSCLDGLFIPSEPDCNFSQYKGQRKAWDNLPINLFMDNSVNDLQRNSVIEAVEAIHTQYKRAVFNVVFGVTPSEEWQNNWVKRGKLAVDGKSSIYWISTGWPRMHASKQAITRTRSIGNSLKETDIVINSSAYDFFLATPRPTGVDLKSLYIHELLHSVGLKHIKKDSASVMNPNLAFGAQPQRRRLSVVDKESLRCEYE